MNRLPESPLKYRAADDREMESVYRDFPELPRSYQHGCPTCKKNRGLSENGVILWRGEEWECDCQDQLQRAKHYLVAGIGDVYQRVHYEDWARDPKALDAVKTYKEKHREFTDAGLGIVAYGGLGTGKTMLLILLMKDLIREYGYDAYYTTFGNLMSMFVAGWRDKATMENYRRRISRSKLLMIDDVGRSTHDAMASAEMDNILRTRVQQGRPTFITMNLELDEFSKTYGGAAMSLLTERSVELRLDGESYREAMNDRVITEVLKGERRPIY